MILFTSSPFHLFTLSGLRNGRREVAGLDCGLKPHSRVAAVAEGLVCRVPAAAKRDDRAPAESELVSGGVFDHNTFAHHAKRPVVVTDDFYLVAHLWLSFSKRFVEE
jgi:hypothetical protein